MFTNNYNRETKNKLWELVNEGSTYIYLVSTLSTYPILSTSEDIDMCYKDARETYFYYKDNFLKEAEKYAEKYGWTISIDRYLDTENWGETGSFLCVFTINLTKNSLKEQFRITFRTIPLFTRSEE